MSPAINNNRNVMLHVFRRGFSYIFKKVFLYIVLREHEGKFKGYFCGAL